MNDPITPAPVTSYVSDFVHEGIIELKTTIGHEKLELAIGIQGFAKQQQIWLKEIIPRQIQKAYEHGFIEARHQIRKRLKETLGIIK